MPRKTHRNARHARFVASDDRESVASDDRKAIRIEIEA
jgi:hypothetical protein